MQKELLKEVIDVLEAEVNNGGFHQYFLNSSGDRANQALEALEVIGAHNMASILRGAMTLFPDGIVPVNRQEREGLLLSIAPECDEFDEFDTEFYKYPDDLSKLLSRHLSG